MSEQQPELLPCPFCGSRPAVTSEINPYYPENGRLIRHTSDISCILSGTMLWENAWNTRLQPTTRKEGDVEMNTPGFPIDPDEQKKKLTSPEQPKEPSRGKYKLQDITNPEYKDVGITLCNEFHNRQIHIKWDGCVHINNYNNGHTIEQYSPDNRDYIHVCELQEFIEQLQEALKRAKEKGFEV